MHHPTDRIAHTMAFVTQHTMSKHSYYGATSRSCGIDRLASSNGAQDGTRNSSKGPPWWIDPMTHRTMSEHYISLSRYMEWHGCINVLIISLGTWNGCLFNILYVYFTTPETDDWECGYLATRRPLAFPPSWQHRRHRLWRVQLPGWCRRSRL